MADIKLISGALLGISIKEMRELLQVLKCEYGVAPEEMSESEAEMAKMFFSIKEVKTQSVQRDEIVKNPKIFVPRVIGKPCKPYVKPRK